LQAYQNQQQTPGLEDMNEFNQIIKKRAALIKKSLIGSPNLIIEKERKTESKTESKSK
jgi:hypothetical protein